MTFPRPGDDGVINVLGDDTMYLADRLDRIVAYLEQLADTTVRQENPAPQLLEILSPTIGIAAATQFGRQNTSVRHRVSFLVIVAGDGATPVITLRVGARRYPFPVSTRLSAIPFPIVIDSGSDISAECSTTSTITCGFYIFSYPE